MSSSTTRPASPLRHVVAATDFSEPAAAGVAWARDLARAHGATLHLVHTAFLFDASLAGDPSTPATVQAAPDDLVKAVLDAARERLDPLVKEIASEGIEVRGHADVGAPSAVVLEVADQVKADLVVIATRGLGGFRRLLLGSTAERVIRHAAPPVLSVHETDGSAARPIRHVLVPTDFSRDARLAVETAIRVGRLGEASKVHLLHVFDLPPEYNLYQAPSVSGLYRRNRETVLAELEERIAELAREIGDGALDVTTEVAEGHPAEVVVDRAAELGVDLVAMGTHGRSGLQRLVLGSVARRVVQHAPCPVLTVRAADRPD